MYYFAYGSNLLPARLRARCPSAALVGTAVVPGYHLCFRKSGRDGSAKADLAADPYGRAYGAVFAIHPRDQPALDRAESLGRGYERREWVVPLRQPDTAPTPTRNATITTGCSCRDDRRSPSWGKGASRISPAFRLRPDGTAA